MCGIVGIYGNRNVAHLLFYALLSLQHRGQESCGIVTRNSKDFKTEKGMGLVTEVFNLEKIKKLSGNVGIGHVRYSTMGLSKIENAQPFVVSHSKVNLAVAHNGNIVNVIELRKKLEASGQAFVSTTDSEIIAHLIVREFVKHGDIVYAIKEVMKKLIGSYSLVILTQDELIGVRDPLGIRPLSIGIGEGIKVLASETVAFDALNAEFLRDVKPGEIVVIRDDEIESYRYPSIKNAYCMFEYVYFARPDSIINGAPVYKVRETIGRLMARKDDVEADIVSPIPDSAIPFALGYSKEKGLPYVESLIRNRYIGRTFILPEQNLREIAVKLKLNPVRTNVKNKRVVLFDDSIVRGTTSRRIIKLLKNAGAKEVHMRVGCPPIRYPCMLGIDMPTREELIASKRSIEEIRKEIGADSLKKLEIEDLIKAIGVEREKLCLGCLTGEYPVKIPKTEQVPLKIYYERIKS